MSKISLSKLQVFLKAQCDDLRAAGLDASEYKDYIIAMLFLKRVNDLFDVAQIIREKNLKKEHPNITQAQLDSELEIENATEYEFFVPTDARWKVLQMLTENIGDGLTIALNSIENSRKEILEGVLSGTKFNALKSNGDKLLTDEVLKELLDNFNEVELKDENFEFPDLLGAAYEFLIKHFAESAGKKGGEFYTPNEVVQLMAHILQPGERATMCDPTVGSGGLLINLRNYVEARYGNARNLSIHGQELKEGIYKMCKMNMIFHGIKNANIKMGDTLANPLLKKDGVLLKFDIVVANPPFSQNYKTDGMQHKERFQNWTSTKKQADFMFLQHMVSTLNNDGRMAVVMPHGVLFRGGEEQRIRKRLINAGLIEAIIGLPPALFFGTGIPASLIIINKHGAGEREHVLFINADKEYKEGKNQNKLRSEDIDKITYVYHNKIDSDKKYSKLVHKDDIEKEEYNCNIRRYVDNSPPATAHDVHAHLKGGIPVVEINALDKNFDCYDGLKKSLFTSLKKGYDQFVPTIDSKEKIKEFIDSSTGKKKAFAKYTLKVNEFWKKVLPKIESLPTDKSVYGFTKHCTAEFSAIMGGITNPLLSEFQLRGSFAQYIEDLKYDFKSIAASAWKAELIPDDEILESQFPEVLAKYRNALSRRDELEALFETVNELEEGEWNEEDYEAIPKKTITKIKAQIKLNTKQKNILAKEMAKISKQIKAYEKDVNPKKGKQDQKQFDLALEHSQEAVNAEKSNSEKVSDAKKQIEQLTEKAYEIQNEITPFDDSINADTESIKKHVALEDELKKCRTEVKELERYKATLVEEARAKITVEEAKELIIKRWEKTLHKVIDGYQEIHTRNLIKAICDIYDKYVTTLDDVLISREKETKLLEIFLMELGYE
jgi:type I restriction enzyme M protein